MLTIDPRPDAVIGSPKTTVALYTPPRLTCRTRSKSTSRASASGGWSMPALLTSTVGGRSSPSRTASSAARSVTSASSTSMPITSAPACASASHQIGPSLPRAPVTSATSPASAPCIGRRLARGSVAVAGGQRRAVARLDDLEGQRVVAHERPAQAMADEALELVGRQSVARRLEREVALAQDVPGGQVARGDDLLGHLGDRRDLALVDALLAIAERHVEALEVAAHLAQPLGLERELVVGALHDAAEGEVLLDDPRAEDVRGDRHRDPVVVAGQADDGVREQLAVGGDDLEVELLPRCRVARRALQQRDLRVDLTERLVAAADVVERRAASRDDRRLAERGDVAQQGRVDDVGRGDLVGRHVELGQEVGGADVEGGGEEGDADALGVGDELLVGLAAELQRLAVRAVRGPERVLVLVGLVVHLARVERGVVALLRLDGVRPRAAGLVDEVHRLVDVALVVVADLRDDVGLGVIADLATIDGQRADVVVDHRIS